MTYPDPGQHKSVAEEYDQAAILLKELFLQYDLTPAEAVDHLAVQKGQWAATDWADVRDVDPSAVSQNIASADEKVNTARLDIEIDATEETVIARVTGDDGQVHELPFPRSTDVIGHGQPGEGMLTLVYEANSAVHGYYEVDGAAGREATLWFDGRPTNAFEEFDFRDKWGSPKAKADVVLWERDDDSPHS